MRYVPGSMFTPRKPSSTASMDRRESGRQIDLGLHGFEMLETAGGRPHALLHGRVANAHALVQRPIWPDVHESRHDPVHAIHDARQRRELGALLQHLLP